MASFTDLNTTLGILNAIGVIASLLFTGVSFQKDSRMRKLDSLLALTEHHRDIWTLILDRPNLRRILRDDPEVTHQKITDEELLVATLIFLHVQIVYEGTKAKLIPLDPLGVQRDLRILLKRPVLKESWARIRQFQNEDFVRYIDGIVHGN